MFFFIFCHIWWFLQSGAHTSSMLNFAKSSNMSKKWRKSHVQLVFNPFFSWFQVPKNWILGAHYATKFSPCAIAWHEFLLNNIIYKCRYGLHYMITYFLRNPGKNEKNYINLDKIWYNPMNIIIIWRNCLDTLIKKYYKIYNLVLAKS